MSSKSSFGLPQLLRERHSTRNFDAAKPITLAELAQFLDAHPSRIHATFEGKIEELGEESPVVSYAIKPYPGAGGAYELPSSISPSTGARASGPRLLSITPRPTTPWRRSTRRRRPFDAFLSAAEFATGASAAPQVLITVAARFGPDFLEIQLARLRPHPQGHRRADRGVLPDGNRDGAGRLRHRPGYPTSRHCSPR